METIQHRILSLSDCEDTHMAEHTVPTSNGRKYLIALVAALGLIPIALDATVVNVVLTPIRQALHADVNTAAWIIIINFFKML